MAKEAKLTDVVGWPGVHEACRQLETSPGFVYTLIWSGRLAAQKVGGQWRVAPQAIEAYSAKRKARRGR